MSSHHHPQRLTLAHAKLRLQNRNDELAGCEIIIDQDDFMQTRPFDLYLILDLGPVIVLVMELGFIHEGPPVSRELPAVGAWSGLPILISIYRSWRPVS